jgi:uncharacterized protein YjbI with pentapeptide repeats
MFPLSTQKGSDCSSINHQKIKLMAENGLVLNKDRIVQILEAHHSFLVSGGAGGRWKTLQVGDLVIGLYDSNNTGNGEQAIFERMNLTKISFNKLALPFANFCGVFATETDFSFSDLSYSLFTDATLEGANFEGANLRKVDFSRSNLKEAKFINANLYGVDFENCDLSNADFTGATFDTARFPGVNLKGIKY